MKNSSEPIRNCDLQPFLCILLDNRFPTTLINVIAEYAKSKENKEAYLFIQVTGNARYEQLHIDLVNSTEECSKFMNVLRKEFNLPIEQDEHLDDVDDVVNTFEEIVEDIPGDHFDDSNLLQMYKLDWKESNRKFKLVRKCNSFIRGSNT